MNRRATRIRVGAVTVAIVSAVTLSAATAAPGTHDLPAIALGWNLLFILERAGALLAIVGGIGLIALRTARGELPLKVGSVEYALRNSSANIEDLRQRIRLLETLIGLPPSVENGAGPE